VFVGDSVILRKDIKQKAAELSRLHMELAILLERLAQWGHDDDLAARL
jgi:hypothetical protein